MKTSESPALAVLPVTLLLTLVAVACDSGATKGGGVVPDASSSSSHPFRDDARAWVVQDDLETTETASVGEWGLATLCQSAYYMDGGFGIYRVRSLTGVSESDLGEPLTASRPWMYIEFDRIEDVSGTSPADLVLRIPGGPVPWEGDLDHVAWSAPSVEFSQGETVALFIKAAEPENAGFPGTEQPGVFRSTDGETFVQPIYGLEFTRSELVRVIRSTYDALPDVDHPFEHDCYVEIPWELCPAESLVPERAPMFDTYQPDCDREPEPSTVDERPRNTSGEPDSGY